MSLKSLVLKEVDRIRNRIIEISDYIHRNPELGYQEFKAAEILSLELEKHNFKVERNVVGIPTAFIATYASKPGGPRIGFLAEYDALPELGHACGHNIIGAAAVGAAIALSKVMSKLQGSLEVFGTPAEEGYTENAGGKVLMLDRIKKLDVAMMVHPSDSYTVEEATLAREAFEIEFKGKPAHGAIPLKGINALDAIILTFNGINALRQHLESDVRVHGIITKGGVSPNIIPDHCVARFYARALTIERLRKVMRRIKNCAKGAALATGAKMSFRKTANTYENLIPNRTLAELFKKNLLELGVNVEDPLETKRRRGLASSDIGNVSRVVPTVYATIAIGPKGLLWHTREFAKAAASKRGHTGLIIGAKALAMTAIDLFNNPELVEKAKNEYISYKKKTRNCSNSIRNFA